MIYLILELTVYDLRIISIAQKVCINPLLGTITLLQIHRSCFAQYLISIGSLYFPGVGEWKKPRGRNDRN